MSRRGLLITLAVSLALNLFLVGGLAGAFLSHGDRRGPHGPPPPGRLAGVGQALSSEHRAGWDAAIGGAVSAAAPGLREARALRRQAWDAIAKDPAQAQAALATLTQSRALEGQARAQMDQAVVTFAATLPAAERVKLAEALRKRGPRGGGRRLGGGDRPGPDQRGLPDR